MRPGWELIYNYYVNRKVISAPYSRLYAEKVRPEGGGGDYGPNSGGYDQLGYGTLMATLTADPAGLIAPRESRDPRGDRNDPRGKDRAPSFASLPWLDARGRLHREPPARAAFPTFSPLFP